MRVRVAIGVVTTAAVLALAAPAQAQPPLEAMPAILRLQLSQHPAWRDYKDAMAETHAAGEGAEGELAQINALPTPARIDAMREQLREERRSFERQAAATQAFYAVLSPEQKQVFDDLTRLQTPPSPMRGRQATDGGANSLRLPPEGGALAPPAR